MRVNITSRMSRLNFHAKRSLSLQGYRVQENLVWPSTPSSLKDSVVMLNLYRPTPANSWVRWISRMWILLKAFHQQSLLIRNLPIAILAQRSELSPRSMTISAFSLLVRGGRTVRNVAKRSLARVHNRLLIRFSQCRQQRSFRY